MSIYYPHLSNTAHIASVNSIMSRYHEASTEVQWEIKGQTRTQLYVPPKIRLLKNVFSNTKDKLPEETDDQVGIYEIGSGKHMGWAIEDFALVPDMSLDPKWRPLNGKQISGSGHAHLIVVKSSEYTQMMQWFAGVAGVEQPKSMRRFGGLDWYLTDRIHELQEPRYGKGTMITASSFIGPFAVETGVLYEAIFYLVNIDDARLDDFGHIKPVGQLQTRVRFIAA